VGAKHLQVPDVDWHSEQPVELGHQWGEMRHLKMLVESRLAVQFS
jgi:hypothetical protein